MAASRGLQPRDRAKAIARGPRSPRDREKIRQGNIEYRERVIRGLELLALVEGRKS